MLISAMVGAKAKLLLLVVGHMSKSTPQHATVIDAPFADSHRAAIFHGNILKASPLKLIPQKDNHHSKQLKVSQGNFSSALLSTQGNNADCE